MAPGGEVRIVRGPPDRVPGVCGARPGGAVLSPARLQCDQVMEFSWSALWNITDETPDNCEMFLNFNGMKLFLDCLKVAPAPPPAPRPPASRLHQQKGSGANPQAHRPRMAAHGSPGVLP